MSKLKPRERDAIVQALRAGVVPKLGLRHIQVGRVREIEELVKDWTGYPMADRRSGSSSGSTDQARRSS